MRDTLAIQQRVRGEEHLHTLITAGSLALLLANTGQHAAAAELGRDALAQAQRTLGPNHPRSLEIARTLATALGKTRARQRRPWRCSRPHLPRSSGPGCCGKVTTFGAT